MEVDYSNSGMTISGSIMHAVRTHGKDIVGIRWGARMIWHVNRLAAPRKGIVRLELLRWNKAIRQAVDLEVKGKIVVGPDEHVKLLRTWCNDELEDAVEYEYSTRDGCITTWNAFLMPRTDQPEMWTANAGMWYEDDGSGRVIHCNAGMTSPPTFADLVYRISTRTL